MKRLYILFLAVFALLVPQRSEAQEFDLGGTVFNNDLLGWYDLYNLSFTAHNYGTARSMAMGNAFTALGADMVSATLNPAGIGMYIKNDISISPMLQFSQSPTKGGEPYYLGSTPRNEEFTERNTRLVMSSMGGIFTAYRSTGALTNLNIGIVYNRIADFNQNSRSASRYNPATESLANVLCNQANADGLTTNSDGTMPFPANPYYWGATLAYKNGLINKDADGWFIDRIGANAEVDQYSAAKTRGSIGEYAFTVGMNFSDIFYLGATLGIQSVSYKRTTYYGEDYVYPNGAPGGVDMPYQVQYMNYMQTTELSGSGVNFKIGATVRPVQWLRIGIAYHTPTAYDVALRYRGDMWSCTYSAGDNPEKYDIDKDGYMYDDVKTEVIDDSGNYSWHFSSPSRLLVGAAVTIAQRVILSADYERSWYQSVRLRNAPVSDLDYTAITKEVFKGGSTLRLGAEGYILPGLALRAGYIWSGSTMNGNYKDAVLSHSAPTSLSAATAGVGLQLTESIYLDLAYQYSITRYTPHQSFYAIDYSDAANDIMSATLTTDTTRHLAVATLGFRF